MAGLEPEAEVVGASTGLHVEATTTGNEEFQGSMVEPDGDVFGHVTTNRSLVDTIDPALLRGVSYTHCLDGFGRIWGRSSSSSGAEFRKSKPCTILDDFISHDWGTPRWSKFATICLHYNSAAAFALWGIIALSIMTYRQVAQTHDKDSTWSPYHVIVIEHHLLLLVHALLLGYGHRVQGYFRALRTVFIDKACIHQHDEELKKTAILGLAAFIKASRNLVILWTPNTFNRMWCAYEAASWAHFDKGADHVKVQPVFQARLVVSVYVVVYITTQCYLVYYWIGFWSLAFTGVLGFLVMLSLSVILVHVQQDVNSADDLRSQLASFAIERSRCYCCDVNHVDPTSGQPIPCDRELVSVTLREWVDQEQPDPMPEACVEDHHLHHFNRKVRTTLSQIVRPAGVASTVLYPALMTAFLPAWAVCVELHRDTAPWRWITLFVLVTNMALTLPISFYLLLRLVRAVPLRMQFFIKVLIALFPSTVVMLCMALLMEAKLILSKSEEMRTIPAAVIAVELVIFFLGFHRTRILRTLSCTAWICKRRRA